MIRRLETRTLIRDVVRSDIKAVEVVCILLIVETPVHGAAVVPAAIQRVVPAHRGLAVNVPTGLAGGVGGGRRDGHWYKAFCGGWCDGCGGRRGGGCGGRRGGAILKVVKCCKLMRVRKMRMLEFQGIV